MTAPAPRGTCPAGCGRVLTDQILCPTCWHTLPRQLRRTVRRTWKAWADDINDGDRRRAFTTATHAAIRTASRTTTGALA